VLNTAVDEAIRWASPANHFMRYALEDVTLRDKKISVGDAVVVWLGSANRDAEHFDDPFAFNIRRKPNRHITFGAGDHYCVGHTVARLSVKLLLQEMVAAFDSFERVGEVSHLYSNFVAGVKHLPIEAKIKANARPLVAAR
jgi:cytochrome P450